MLAHLKKDTTWLTACERKHCTVALAIDVSSVSRAARGRSSKVEETLTRSRLMIKVFEVVRRDSLRANTMSKDRLTARERIMVMASMAR